MKRNLFFDEPKSKPEKLFACLLGSVHKLFLLGPLFFLTAIFGFTLLSSWTALFSVDISVYVEIMAFRSSFISIHLSP